MTIHETRRTLVEYFEQLPDSRQRGKTLYPLEEIILTRETIVEKKADYVVTLKENQPKLYKYISLYFEGILSQTLSCSLSTHKNVIKVMGV
jgi:hypothetical protein